MRLGTPKTPGPYGMEPAWRADFLSADELAGQGISLFPAATPPSVNQGVAITLQSQVAVVPVGLLGGAFSGGVANQVSFYCEFFPTWAWPPAEGLYYNLYTLYSAAPASQYTAFFYTTGGVNRLWISVGATAFTYVGNAVIAAQWRQNSRNRFCAALGTGSNDVYINGQSIGATNGTAWTRVQYASSLYVGNNSTANAGMLGSYTDFHIYNRKLTAAEAIQLTTVT